MVPSFKNTALILPEISFIQFLPLLSIITDLTCVNYRKTPISSKRKKIFQKEKRHSSVFKGLSNKKKKNFVSYTL